MFSPLEQFDVIPLIFFSLGNYDITFFNIFLPLLLIISVLYFIESFYINYKLVPSNIQYLFESIIEFIIGIIKNQIGKEGFLFLPFIFTVFIFVLCANLLSVIPFGIALTSHLIVTM
jgi:F0F1-type ATP synthase membrane subunit a